MSGVAKAVEERSGFSAKMDAAPAAEGEQQRRRWSDGCNPVKKPGPVSMDHVLLALRETREEREVRVRSLFNFFDAAGVGHLDYAQIDAGLSSLRVPAEYKYARDLLKVCDANRDGRVDYQEFRRYMDDKELELYRIFQAIDVEHNGCILPEELWDALVKAGKIIDYTDLPLIGYDISAACPMGNWDSKHCHRSLKSWLVV
ncbi:hypothetical protein GW17_00003663 [Ensete ventricosum]|nr:hypothetical protein GW17_00003663 [Ensete ventricosum]